MATTRLVVALALACAIDASVETERVDALGSGELARCVMLDVQGVEYTYVRGPLRTQ